MQKKRISSLQNGMTPADGVGFVHALRLGRGTTSDMGPAVCP